MVSLVAVLKWLHLLSLAAGGAATFGIPVVAAQMASASEDVRQAQLRVILGLGRVGKWATLAMVATGIAMVWAGGYDVGALGWTFWVKMAAVVGLFAASGLAARSTRRMMAGDVAAESAATAFGIAATAMVLLTTGMAVLTFG